MKQEIDLVRGKPRPLGLGGFTDCLALAERYNDEESEVYRLLGEIRLFQLNFDKARTFHERAYRLNPNDDKVLSQMACYHSYCGQPEKAIDFAKKAMRHNPYHPDFYWVNLARAALLLDRPAEAIEALGCVERKRVGHWALLAASHAANEQEEAAREACEALLAIKPEFQLSEEGPRMSFLREEDRSKIVGLMQGAGLPT